MVSYGNDCSVGLVAAHDSSCLCPVPAATLGFECLDENEQVRKSQEFKRRAHKTRRWTEWGPHPLCYTVCKPVSEQEPVCTGQNMQRMCSSCNVLSLHVKLQLGRYGIKNST